MPFRSIFIRKSIIRKKDCKSWRRNCKSWLWFFNLKRALIPPHPLAIFEIQEEYYENKPRFNGVYSRDNLTKIIKNRAYVTNLDELADVGIHWIALQVKNNKVI